MKKSILFIFLFVIGINFNAMAYQDFGEIQDYGARNNIQAMRAFQTQWSNWLFYTMNVDTPGFIETGAFNSRLVDSKGDKKIDAVPFYRWRAGPVVETNRDLDCFIEASSKGFFVIQLPTTVGYTRDGRFHRDSSDRLVTVAGNYPVLGLNGVITLPRGDVSITSAGTIYLDGQDQKDP